MRDRISVELSVPDVLCYSQGSQLSQKCGQTLGTLIHQYHQQKPGFDSDLEGGRPSGLLEQVLCRLLG